MTSEIYAETIDRLIEVEFEQVHGAKEYEVKVSPIGSSANKPKSYILKNTLFSERLALGEWKIEVRSFDKRGIGGRWQLLGDVKIAFKAPTMTSPTKGQSFQIPKGSAAAIKFQWESFHPQAQYLLSVKKTSDNQEIIKKVVRGNSFEAKIKKGNYTWTLISEIPKGIELEGTNPDPLEFDIAHPLLADVVISKFEQTPPSSINWASVENAEFYDVKLDKIKDEDGKDLEAPINIFAKYTRALKYNIPAKLQPGFYRASVIAKARKFESSNLKFEDFQIEKAPETTASQNKEPSKPDKNGKKQLDFARHIPMDYLQGSIGPTFWQYNFNSVDGQNFNLFALSVTAISADATKWFAKSSSSAWAFEVRGRQTNIFLFDPPPEDAINQKKVTVADRRIAAILRKRSIYDRVGLDFILGFGTHYYTYLIQSGIDSVVEPVYGNLLEYYIGGAIDWQLLNGNHASFDLTFHPVSSSVGISALRSLQYTASLRYIKNIFHERSNLSLNLESISSKVTVNSEDFGTATTTNTWYRFGVGAAFKI